ncbi:MAG: hypothetical protein ACRD3N_16755 [Terracidiphilus sp.]
MSDRDDSMTDIRYRWIPVESDRGIPFEFNSETFPRITHFPQRPAICRWVFLKNGIPVKAYVGETENLLTRIRGYLNPGPSQETNKRINAESKAAILLGLTVRLEILRIEPIRINRVRVCNENLSDPYVRKMMENFVLADFDVVHCELLNAALNPLERRKRKAMKDNPMEDFFQQHGL